MQNSEPADFVETLVNVRYAETDRMGVVYYANYLVWFEVGRVAWCKDRGFSYRDMELKEHLFMMVAEATCRYKAPALFDDEVLIRTAVAAASEKVVRFRYEIRNNADGRVLATGESVHVVTDAELRPARLPSHYRPIFGLPENSS